MRLSIVLCLLISVAQPAIAQTPDPAGVFRYRLSAMGGNAGELALTIGEEKIAAQQLVRSVRFEARTAGLAQRLHPALGSGTAILSEDFWPSRVRWEAEVKGNARGADARIVRSGVRGSYRREGRETTAFTYRSDSRPLDAISVYAWVPRQDLTPGHQFEHPLFDGRRLSTLRGTVGRPGSLQTSLGLREAVPVHLTIARPGLNQRGPSEVRKVTLWVGTRDRVLYRMETQFGSVGRVTAELIGVRRPGA